MLLKSPNVQDNAQSLASTMPSPIRHVFDPCNFKQASGSSRSSYFSQYAGRFHGCAVLARIKDAAQGTHCKVAHLSVLSKKVSMFFSDTQNYLQTGLILRGAWP